MKDFRGLLALWALFVLIRTPFVMMDYLSVWNTIANVPVETEITVDLLRNGDRFVWQTLHFWQEDGVFHLREGELFGIYLFELSLYALGLLLLTLPVNRWVTTTIWMVTLLVVAPSGDPVMSRFDLVATIIVGVLDIALAGLWLWLTTLASPSLRQRFATLELRHVALALCTTAGVGFGSLLIDGLVVSLVHDPEQRQITTQRGGKSWQLHEAELGDLEWRTQLGIYEGVPIRHWVLYPRPGTPEELEDVDLFKKTFRDDYLFKTSLITDEALDDRSLQELCRFLAKRTHTRCAPTQPLPSSE